VKIHETSIQYLLDFYKPVFKILDQNVKFTVVFEGVVVGETCQWFLLLGLKSA